MLNQSVIKAAKPQPKPYRLPDFGGLFLLVQPSGSKLWRWRYQRPGSKKENMLSFGPYPTVSLQDAREAREDASRLLIRGIDPGLKKKVERMATAQKAASTFGAVAREYLDKRDRETAGDPFKRERNRFEHHLAPILGDVPIADVTAPMLLAALRKPEAAGKLETARRLRAMSGRIFRFAIATGRATSDPSAHLIGALTMPMPTNFAAATASARVRMGFRLTAGADILVRPLTPVQGQRLRLGVNAQVSLAHEEVPVSIHRRSPRGFGDQLAGCYDLAVLVHYGELRGPAVGGDGGQAFIA
ncbi:MAG: tyrosine-type recombinase/integrase [Lysobacter sp.]